MQFTSTLALRLASQSLVCVGAFADSRADMLALVFILAGIGFVIAFWLASWVLARDEGPKAMRDVSNAIREGGEGFLGEGPGAVPRSRR